MMIKPIGKYLTPDENGFLHSDCHWENVPLHWQELIETVKSAYLEKVAADLLHSIYLRGSVAAGIAVDGVADLDTFALVRQPGIHWAEMEWSTAFENQWLSAFPFVQSVEVMQSGIVAGQLVNPFLQPILKLQSICLYGENIIPALPNCRLDKSLQRNARWLKEDVATLKQSDHLPTADIQSILKSILRSGFELVMEREQAYTLDLYPCYQSFAKYYPEWEGEMKKVLLYFLEVPVDRQLLTDIAEGLGKWLGKTLEEEH